MARNLDTRIGIVAGISVECTLRTAAKIAELIWRGSSVYSPTRAALDVLLVVVCWIAVGWNLRHRRKIREGDVTVAELRTHIAHAQRTSRANSSQAGWNSTFSVLAAVGGVALLAAGILQLALGSYYQSSLALYAGGALSFFGWLVRRAQSSQNEVARMLTTWGDEVHTFLGEASADSTLKQLESKPAP